MTIKPENLRGNVTLYGGDCLKVLVCLPENSVASCITDPPYHLTSIVKRFAKTSLQDDNKTGQRARAREDGMARLSRGFMGKFWDGGDVAFQAETWRAVYRVLKPGGYLAAFGGTRTYDLLVAAVRAAGFEIRDTIAWTYGSGFPKATDISKAIDKEAGAKRSKVRVTASRCCNPKATGGGKNGLKGATRPFIDKALQVGYHEIDDEVPITDEAREWLGWKTALKPAMELIVVARKPLSEKTVAANVLRWGTGAMNIGACMVIGDDIEDVSARSGMVVKTPGAVFTEESCGLIGKPYFYDGTKGRYPANFVHDGSDEVVAAFPNDDKPAPRQKVKTTVARPSLKNADGKGIYGGGKGLRDGVETSNLSINDVGSAARFFYTAKADGQERVASVHPTVKPVDLKQWLVRLFTRKGETVLDPFAGTGTTGEAAFLEGMRSILIEREPEYQIDIKRRMQTMQRPFEREVEVAKGMAKRVPLPEFLRGSDANSNHGRPASKRPGSR